MRVQIEDGAMDIDFWGTVQEWIAFYDKLVKYTHPIPLDIDYDPSPYPRAATQLVISSSNSRRLLVRVENETHVVLEGNTEAIDFFMKNAFGCREFTHKGEHYHFDWFAAEDYMEKKSAGFIFSHRT